MARFKTILILLALSILPIAMHGSKFSPRVDSLLQVLDKTIKHKPEYEAQKRARINHLVDTLRRVRMPEEQFAVTERLFKEYSNFSMDTSLLVARDGRRLAERLGNDTIMWRAMLMEAEGLKGLGYYLRALAILDSIPPRARAVLQQPILDRYSSVYFSLQENTLPQSDAKRYLDSLLSYRDSLINTCPTAVGRAINEIERMKHKGQYQQAIEYYQTIRSAGCTENENAVLDFIVAEAYLKTGQTDTALQYLLESAIADIRRSDRKYSSLPLIAEVLYDNGDIGRSYEYIMCSISDIRASNAQSRMRRITDAIPIISQTYDKYQSSLTRGRRLTYGITLILVIVVAAFSFKLVRINRKLKAHGDAMEQRNIALEASKNTAESLNQTLESEARTKEDYIGELFNLYSEHINIIAREHKSILKMARNGNTRDIERTITSLQGPEKLGKFFAKFDQCILDIFPDFIQRFNSLLLDEYQFDPTEKQLTPELRIFALIRLGITDTQRIAAFLQYSTQTVYNYRARMRQRARCDKNEFEEAVRTL